MTGAEMERAIECILQHQATLDEQVKQVNARNESEPVGFCGAKT